MKPGNDQAAAVLDQSALDAVKQYRFQPATLNGQPIPVLFNVEIKFRIF
jgi:TonB family protein